MCQIIHKPKGYVLRDDLLESTCTVNGDGYGYMYFNPDDNSIASGKVFDGDNNPEAIRKVMEDLRDHEVFFHFRYKTMGKVDTDSCHPFLIYDDYDHKLLLMHNGTLSGYGSSTQVDSEDFGLKVAGPLYGTFLKSGVKSPLTDKLYKDILLKFVGGSSKIVLMDSTGTAIIVNQNGGEEYEDKDANVKFWVSNTYSFNSTHRGTNNYVYGYGRYGGMTPTKEREAKVPEWLTDDYEKGENGVYYKKSSTENQKRAESATPFQESLEELHVGMDAQDQSDQQLVASTSQDTPDTDSVSQSRKSSQELTVTTATETVTSEQKSGRPFPQRKVRESYIYNVLGLFDVESLFDLEFSDIDDLVEDDPEGAKLLINELINHLYQERYEGDF